MRKRNILAVSIISAALILGLIPREISATPTSKATGYGLSNPRVEENGTVTWDCIYFGNYWQNDTNGDDTADQNDDKEPVKWRVLSVDGDDAFLLADQNLDCQPYNEEKTDVTWETCTLRQWLNNDFYQNAFDSSEQSAIRTTNVVNEDNSYYGTEGGNNTSDKVYLLSIDEASNATYGFSTYDKNSETREAKNTAYAKQCGASTASLDSCAGDGWWWWRSPGMYSYYAAGAGCGGYVDDYGFRVVLNDRSVRPCLHLNLSSNTWTKADTVTATGGTFVTPTPDPTPTPTPTKKPTPKPTATPIITPKPTYTVGVVTHSPIKPTETATPTPSSTPRAITAPSKPTKLSVKNNKKKSVTLSWKKVNGATSYQIQYAANTAFAKKKLKSTKKTKLVIKNLKKKKTYSFRVRAYKVSNNVKVYGSWSKAKKIKIKK